MPRAHRHFLPGYVWHLTHRCHKQEFLLKFSRDRQRWIHWLFEARKRYGLCVLNYIVTSNHIHLLVMDTGNNTIARSMQLIAGRTAQEYNQRKQRKGAFWEDRYYATAIETDAHFIKCVTYIDLNMVRAGVVQHPRQWRHAGYHEIQSARQRYRIIDINQLMTLCNINSHTALSAAHTQWLEHGLLNDVAKRITALSDSVAVGSQAFIEQVQTELGLRAQGRKCEREDSDYVLREHRMPYTVNFTGKNSGLSLE